MKRIFSALAAIILCSSIVGCNNINEETALNGVLTLSLAESEADGYIATLTDKRFAKEVHEASNGHIAIEVHANAELGTEGEVLKLVKEGEIDFAHVNVAEVVKYDEKMTVVMMPYLYENSEHMWKVLESDLGKDILEIKGDDDLVGIAWYDAGYRNFYFSKKISSLEDIKGLRIRTKENEVLYALVRAMGGIEYAMDYRDIKQAIADDVIDGADGNMPIYESFGMDSVAPYYLQEEYIRVPEILVCSAKTLNSLPEEYRDNILEAGLNSQHYQKELWNKREETSLSALSIKGVELIKLSAEDNEKIKNECMLVYEQYPQYSELFKEIEEMK